LAVSLMIEPAASPKSTAVAPPKFVPVIVTVVPPANGPAEGLMLVTAGAPRYVNWSAEEIAETPPGLLTVTLAMPIEAIGLTAVIWVAELTVKVLAGIDPKSTAIAVVNPVPLIVTDVPPVAGPIMGLMPVTDGVAT